MTLITARTWKASTFESEFDRIVWIDLDATDEQKLASIRELTRADRRRLVVRATTARERDVATSLRPWMPIFEDAGVQTVILEGAGLEGRTPPIRVGQIDPAGVVYVGVQTHSVIG